MRLELRRLDAMRAATSCHNLWTHVTNDEYWDFRMYVRRATGREIPAYGSVEVAPGGEPPQYWTLAEPVIGVLEWSIDEIDLLLPARPTAFAVDELGKRVERGEVRTPSQGHLNVLQHIVDSLRAHLVGARPPGDGPIDHLVRLPPDP